MSLEGARRVDRAVADDWNARMSTHETRVAGYDDVRVDVERQTAAWMRAGMLMLEAPAELVGVFFPDLGLFRWWWSGKEHAIHLTPSRLDEAFAHAQRADLKALLTRQHQIDGEEDALMLSRVASYFAHATGMVRHEQGDRVCYFAVFAASARAPIVPDREFVRTLPPPPVRASAPPPAMTPEGTPVVREPARVLLLPVVHVAHGLIQRAFREHARSALLVVNVDTSREKARFFVTLVASTKDGDLAALDTTRELLDVAGTMLGEDSRSGNGRWRKLVIRIDCEGGGASIRRCEVT